MERRAPRSSKSTQAAGRGGRPSREEAARLRERILESATELLLARGYEATTVEAVAAHARIAKRTFYHRFDDKAALFAAVVHQIINRIRPPANVPLIEGATLHEILRRIAGLILRAALSPHALALHRLVTAESHRFPELAQALENDGSTREALDLIGGLLARSLPQSPLSAADREFAAQQFIFMVITVPQRHAMGFGEPMSAAQLEQWADKVVTLFLRGCEGWPRQPPQHA